ncbi:MAG: hypothetical protein B5M53_10935 [Candidatus Cloacimonas sp. 4484_209]|nr:MAG: hypothetical protein B5M53_10935 [Candidatus Cloacimonas sp. 4484_209]
MNIRKLILSHKYERDQLLKNNYISRTLHKKAKRSIGKNIIKVIIGPRRAGKSIFSLQLLKNTNFAYINFDDERLIDIKDYDLIIKGVKEVYGDTKYLLFDEIQNLNKWELFVNRLHRRGYNLIITGSNSRLLSKELATHLTGRYTEFHIYPFSFLEFLKAKKIDYKEVPILKEREGKILNLLNDYLLTGGFPEVVIKSLEPKNYLTSLFEGVLFKDVVNRYNIRYSRNLYNLSLYLVSNFANEFSFTKLKNILELKSVHTVQNYVQYLKEAFLFFSLSRFSYKLKEQLKTPQKTYVYDTGLATALRFGTSPDYGRMVENIVAIELLRREKEIYYYKDKNGSEVDFVVKEGFRISELIQVCYDISSPVAERRELKSLIKAQKLLNVENLRIITWDVEKEQIYKGVKILFIPLWKYLLQ